MGKRKVQEFSTVLAEQFRYKGPGSWHLRWAPINQIYTHQHDCHKL